MGDIIFFRFILKVFIILTLIFPEYVMAAEMGGTDPDVLFRQGMAHAITGQYDQAIAYFNKVIAINPKYDKAYNNRGVAYGAKGQYDKAISDSNKAIALNPIYAEACHNRGFAYYKKGQYEKAINDYNNAIRLNPKFAMAYNNRAVAYFFKRDYGKAWDNVYKAQNLGYEVSPSFLKELRRVSGEEK